jgi:kojibiose phosphorylase
MTTSQAPTRHGAWRITAGSPTAEQMPYYESIFALGNGYLGVRGSREEAKRGESSQPLTLIAEVYDRPNLEREKDTPPGHRHQSRLAPAPDWLSICFHDGRTTLTPDNCRLLEEKIELDMRRGILHRWARYRSPSGRITRLATRRLVSQARPHLAAIQYIVTPENYGGEVEISSFLDGTNTFPDGVVQTKERAAGRDHDTVWLELSTIQSRIAIGAVARHTFFGAENAKVGVRRAREKIGLAYRFTARRGQAVTLEKVVALDSSFRAAAPLTDALAAVANAPAFAELEREHAAAWAAYWRDCDVRITGDLFTQTMARFFVFQLLQAASLNNVRLGLSASIPAKTLSGPGYAGHIFWDTEIFILPFFSQQYPEIAQALLDYRLDRQAAARMNARNQRAAGLKFPWESADTGQEDCAKWLIDHRGRWWRWCGGEEEIHVNADVAMGFWRHHLATGDEGFLWDSALEILVGTARYWASRARHDTGPDGSTWEIRKVIGPDEYHHHVDNNAYTNGMARWNLRLALELIERLHAKKPVRHRAAVRRFRLQAGELRLWREIAKGLKLNYSPVTKLYEQFDGFFARERKIKQADVLMLLHLLPEMADAEVFRRNFELYHGLCAHESSLSPCMHAIVALDAGHPDQALAYLHQACEVDGVRRGNSTDSGLHAAALGGGWSAIVEGFGGVSVTRDCLRVAPRLPKSWRRLEFSLRYRGLRLRFDISPRRLDIRANRQGPRVPLEVLGRRVILAPGGRITRLLS